MPQTILPFPRALACSKNDVAGNAICKLPDTAPATRLRIRQQAISYHQHFRHGGQLLQDDLSEVLLRRILCIHQICFCSVIEFLFFQISNACFMLWLSEISPLRQVCASIITLSFISIAATYLPLSIMP